MRDKHRRLFVLAAAVAAASVVVAPGPITAGQSPLSGRLPGISQVLSIPGGSERGTGEPIVTPAEPLTPAGRTAPPATAAPTRDGESADEASDPSRWVAHMDVLEVDTAPLMPPGDGKCPSATTCDRNLVRPQRWKTAEDGTLEIAWRFNDEGRRNLRAPSGLLEGSVRRSMAEWSSWNSNIVFRYDGTTTAAFGAKGADGSCADGTNTVTWHRFDPSVIAAVVTCIDPRTNTVRDADLALNVTQHWENIRGEPESRHTFDIDSIVTHELGHWLSLLDLYDGDSLRQTMMGNAQYGETRKRTLALGDVVGLQTAYPCDDDDVCPREGIIDD